MYIHQGRGTWGTVLELCLHRQFWVFLDLSKVWFTLQIPGTRITLIQVFSILA